MRALPATILKNSMRNKFLELLILHFLNDGVRTTLLILLPFIAHDFSLSLTQVGFLGSAQPLMAAFLAIPAGYITGRFGGFRIIFALLALYSIGALGIAFSFNIYILFGMFFLAALGFGMFHTVGFVLTADTSAQSDIGRNMGNFTSIGEIGRVALPPLAVFATSLIGWRSTIGAIGIVGLFVYVASRLYISSKKQDEHKINSIDTQNYKEFFKDAYFLFKNKKAAYITTSAIFDSLASSPVYVYLPFLLLSKGLNSAQLGFAMGTFFIGSLLGKSFLGRGVDRFGNVRVFIFSEICMTLVLLCITLNLQYAYTLFIVVLLGIFSKGTSPVVNTMFTELASRDHYHKIFAVSEMIIAISAVLIVLILGRVADTSGIVAIFYITSALALIAVFPIYLSMTNKQLVKVN